MSSKSESLDFTEQYYSHMESDRNRSEDRYFEVRPQLVGSHAEKAIFRAGFERAYELLWNDLQASRRETGRACQETREALSREVAALRGAGETSAPLVDLLRELESAARHCAVHGDGGANAALLGKTRDAVLSYDWCVRAAIREHSVETTAPPDPRYCPDGEPHRFVRAAFAGDDQCNQCGAVKASAPHIEKQEPLT